MKDELKAIEERYTECIRDGSYCVCVSPKITLKDIQNLLKLVRAYEESILSYPRSLAYNIKLNEIKKEIFNPQEKE